MSSTVADDDVFLTSFVFDEVLLPSWQLEICLPSFVDVDDWRIIYYVFTLSEDVLYYVLLAEACLVRSVGGFSWPSLKL